MSKNSEAPAHVPGAILEVMRLIADLTDNRASLRGTPTRLEVCDDDLGHLLLQEGARKLLQSARFLGLKEGVTGRGLEALSQLRSIWGEEARHLDFEGSWGYPPPEAVAAWSAVSVLRLRWRHDGGDVPVVPNYGPAGHLHVDVHAAWSADDRNRICSIIRTLSGHSGPTTLKLTPRTHQVSESLSAAWDEFEALARSCSVGLRAPYLGLKGGAKRSIPGLCGSAILEQAFRSLFAQHPSLCPFPFLMMDLTTSGGARACPHPSGPRVAAEPAVAAWNSEEFQSLRSAFYLGDALPAPCRSCLLLPRVRESLAETLTIRGGRSLDV